MQPPTQLFGFRAVWRAGVEPTEVGRFVAAGCTVQALRWDLRDVVIDTLDLGDDGHVISYVVSEPAGAPRALFQQSSVFYEEEGLPPLTSRAAPRGNGDGVTRPRWHKSDRYWPWESGVQFDFVGQGYVGESVVYLFRHPLTGRLAVFADEVDRQDAAEHYAAEERTEK